MPPTVELRDYFAGQAMLGLIPSWSEVAADPMQLARLAYGYADAMVAARSVNPSARARDYWGPEEKAAQ